MNTTIVIQFLLGLAVGFICSYGSYLLLREPRRRHRPAPRYRFPTSEETHHDH